MGTEAEVAAPYPAWIYRQSAVLPFRRRGDSLEVLLISSRGGKRWVLPKGIVEPGLDAVASAVKEAGEEAGVQGAAGESRLGCYRYRKWGGVCEVAVYPLAVERVLEDWPESGIRRRRWLSVRKAARRVEQRELRAIIESLPEAVSRDGFAAVRCEVARPRLLHLLRHAKSSWTDPTLPDDVRPLAPRGERACEAMRRYMALGDIRPDLVVCSAAVRTRQTLERVMPAFGDGVEVKHYRGLYLASPQAMLDRLRRSPAQMTSVMLVAHNPGTQSLALRLAGSGAEDELSRIAELFPTGALATFVFRGDDWSRLEAGSCELHSFVCPRDLGEDPDRKKEKKSGKSGKRNKGEG